MAVKIVTDSGSDISSEVAQALDISVVPLYVHFGTKTFRDGVDISQDKFYAMLKRENIVPTTSAASPGDFAEVYSKLCCDADEIVSIHLSSKVSATYEAALGGKDLVKGSCRVEVVDSKYVSVGTSLVAVAAARAAKSGQGIEGVLEHISEVIPSIKVIGLLDTLKHVARSGRLGKFGPLLSSVLPVKPLLTMKDGLLSPTGVARTRSKGIEHIYNMVRSAVNIEEISIAHSTVEEEIKAVIEKLKTLAPGITPLVSKMGPAIGTHGGPGSILVAVQQEISHQAHDIAKKQLVTIPSLQSIRESLSHRIQKDNISTIKYAFDPVRV